MDDYDNRTPADQPSPYADFNATLTLEDSFRQAGLHLGVIHRPRSAENLRAAEILLRVNPTESDLSAAASMGVDVTSMNVNVDPNVHPPVSQVSAPAFSGTGRKLEPAEPSAAAESSAEAPASKGLQSPHPLL
eukprot:3677650-Amphidinium_carterae.2